MNKFDRNENKTNIQVIKLRCVALKACMFFESGILVNEENA